MKNQLTDLFTNIICTETGVKKSMNCIFLTKQFKTTKASYILHAGDAIQQAIKDIGNNDLLCIIGSHYFGPHIKNVLNKTFAMV